MQRGTRAPGPDPSPGTPLPRKAVKRTRKGVEGLGMGRGMGGGGEESRPRVVSREPLGPAGFRWLSVARLKYVDARGRQRVWESADRRNRNGEVDGVAVLARIQFAHKGTKTVIIEQFRPPTGAVVLELPAGLVDPGESPEEAAVRELREETGFSGRAVASSPILFSEPGITGANMRLVEVVVDGDARENQDPQQELEEGENIQRHVVDLAGLDKQLLLMMEDGRTVDARLWHLATEITGTVGAPSARKGMTPLASSGPSSYFAGGFIFGAICSVASFVCMTYSRAAKAASTKAEA